MAEAETPGNSLQLFVPIISITYVVAMESCKEFFCMVTRMGTGVLIQNNRWIFTTAAPVDLDVGSQTAFIEPLSNGFLSYI
jgi:hypothetical protein